MSIFAIALGQRRAAAALELVERLGVCLIGQTAEIAPADRKHKVYRRQPAETQVQQVSQAAQSVAIGAQVTLFWNGQQQVQEVSGGSGFAAQNQRRL